MKDPREYSSMEWYQAGHEETKDSNYSVTPSAVWVVHKDVCARLCGKDNEIAALKDALRGLQSEVDMLHNKLTDANVAIGLLRADLMTNLEAVAEAIEPLREQWPEAFEAANLNP